MFNNIFLKSIYKRELGQLEPSRLISSIYEKSLPTFELSKNDSNSLTGNASLTWLSLETIDYKYLLTAKSNGGLICVDLFGNNSNEFVVLFDKNEAHEYCINCIQWYPFDTGMFFTSGMDKVFKVWDANNVKVVDKYQYSDKIYSHHMSPVISSNQSSLVALALHNGNIAFVDLKSGSSTHVLKEHTHGKCVSVQWSPIDGNVLCSAGSDGRIILWDTRASKSFLTSFDYTRSNSKANKKIDSRKNDPKSVAHTQSILGCSFIQGGSYLISVGRDSHIRLWNVLNGTNTLVNYGKTFSNSVVYESCIQLSSTELSNNNFVFIPNHRSLNIYNVFDGELIKTCKGHFESINCCLYHPTLNQLYTGSKDRNLLTWTTTYDCEIDSRKNKIKKRSFTGFSI